ncbi:MAG: peroxiredoxin [Chloroflexi bacterium]|nr:peroxiredoxin [Chloroflexota bacterium]
MAIPQPGQSAPDFEVLSDTGETLRLADLRGQRIVLYFYPKADTPGCTKQACAFRNDYSAYQQKGVVVLGASPNSVEQQAAFKTKYDLPFALLADHDHRIADLYGIWGTHRLRTEAGVEVDYTGILRSTFVIDEQGYISHVFLGVDPANNSREMLDLL